MSSQRTSLPWRLRPIFGACSILAGCQSHALHINLPQGYTGSVNIECVTPKDNAAAMTVDAAGHLGSATCPTHPVDLVILRDGKQVYPDGPVSWPATGDGIIVGVRFKVR